MSHLFLIFGSFYLVITNIGVILHHNLKTKDMTLENYVKGLNEFIKNNPKLKDVLVVYSEDDEGNIFNMVHFTPTKGYYEDKEFTEKEDFDDLGMEEEDINAVCIN